MLLTMEIILSFKYLEKKVKYERWLGEELKIFDKEVKAALLTTKKFSDLQRRRGSSKKK